MSDALDRRAFALLGALVVFAVAVYALLYPATYTIVDEQGYISYGLVLAKGTFFADEASVHALRSERVGDHLVPEFGMGTPALLAPFVAIDWRSAFAVILAVHLLGTGFCALALRRSGLSPVFAALYLFHPVAALYARTAMADVPAMALTMAGVAAWLGPRRHPLLAGLALGFTPHFRFAQAVAVAAFFGASLLRDAMRSREQEPAAQGTRRPLDLRPTLWLGLGLLPGALSLAALNTHLYGSPIDMPVVYPLSASYLPSNLSRYLLTQNLIYPLGLIVAFLFPSKLRLECIAVGVVTLALYGCFRHLYVGFGPSQLVIGDRFFLPLFALIVVPYAGALTWVLERWPRFRTALLAAGLAALAAAYVGMSVTHQRRTEQQHRIQQAVYDGTDEGSVVVCSGMSAYEYFFDGFGERRPLLWPWIDATSDEFNPGALHWVRNAVPNAKAYLLTAERRDRGGVQGRSIARMLFVASRHFRYEKLREIDAWPDVVTLYRITELKP